MKFVLVACLFLAVLAVTFAASPARPELSAHSIIQNLIGKSQENKGKKILKQKEESNFDDFFLHFFPRPGQYEARYHGPSVVHPEEPAHVIDPYNLHI